MFTYQWASIHGRTILFVRDCAYSPSLLSADVLDGIPGNRNMRCVVPAAIRGHGLIPHRGEFFIDLRRRGRGWARVRAAIDMPIHLCCNGTTPTAVIFRRFIIVDGVDNLAILGNDGDTFEHSCYCSNPK